MKALNAIILSLAVLSCWAPAAQAGVVARGKNPAAYVRPTLKAAQAQLNCLRKSVDAKELTACSATAHGVDVIDISQPAADVVPASSRPTGSLQLNKVVILDSK